jgi:hypothetical protein
MFINNYKQILIFNFVIMAYNFIIIVDLYNNVILYNAMSRPTDTQI